MADGEVALALCSRCMLCGSGSCPPHGGATFAVLLHGRGRNRVDLHRQEQQPKERCIDR
uniref:Uncharacterized protein n=1 Tax=Oryza brachyantha TaxID=4533 RepID=J3KZR2_ORYBR